MFALLSSPSSLLYYCVLGDGPAFGVSVRVSVIVGEIIQFIMPGIVVIVVLVLVASAGILQLPMPLLLMLLLSFMFRRLWQLVYLRGCCGGYGCCGGCGH